MLTQLKTAADQAHAAAKTALVAWQQTRTAEARKVAGELGTVAANAEMALIQFKNQNGLV